MYLLYLSRLILKPDLYLSTGQEQNPPGIDGDFIRAREGFRREGYVPEDANGNPHANR